jgi:hypothetical protein
MMRSTVPVIAERLNRRRIAAWNRVNQTVRLAQVAITRGTRDRVSSTLRITWVAPAGRLPTGALPRRAHRAEPPASASGRRLAQDQGPVSAALGSNRQFRSATGNWATSRHLGLRD